MCFSCRPQPLSLFIYDLVLGAGGEGERAGGEGAGPEFRVHML